MSLFCLQIDAAYFEKISLSATGFYRCDPNQQIRLNVFIDKETVTASRLSSGVQIFTWTGTRWRGNLTLTSHTERVAVRWSWTASLETTGSEWNCYDSKSLILTLYRLTEPFWVCLFLVDGEDGPHGRHWQECEPLSGHRPGESRRRINSGFN